LNFSSFEAFDWWFELVAFSMLFLAQVPCGGEDIIRNLMPIFGHGTLWS
jgi:hypothetical protein